VATGNRKTSVRLRNENIHRIGLCLRNI
jgi:hypothetical protein